MADIKTKGIKPKTVKTLDKTVAWTERVKDPIVYANEKAKDATDNQTNIVDYGDDKIRYVSNRVKDETIYAGKKTVTFTKNKTVDFVKKKYQKNKLTKNIPKDLEKAVDKTQKTIKTAERTIKNTEKVAKESTKASKKMLEQGRKLAVEGTKKTVQVTKAAVKGTISAIKGIIAGAKSLVGMLAAGGTLAIIAIIVICLVGLLITSIFGIFFSSENTGKNNIKMSDCIAELNNEMDDRIEQIKNMNPHEELVIDSNKAEWKDILAIYAVRISNGNNEQDVMTIDNEKKKVLREVFWDMNTITYEVKTEKYESDSIGTLQRPEFNLNSNYQRPVAPTESKTEEKKVLHININAQTPDSLKTKYSFSDSQNKQYAELISEKYLTLWSSAIYGVYGSSGEITEWKQKGKEWSNIRIGSTNATIGDIGCLVTSVAILIEKSEVSTNNIYPFNPGTFVVALNNNYGFDANGNLQYSAISKVVPDFKYQGRIELKDKSKNEKLQEIRKYYESGYYLAAEVMGATQNSQHWVAVDNVTNNTVLMLDPGSNATDMWSQYDWNKTTQFVYFKAEK